MLGIGGVLHLAEHVLDTGQTLDGGVGELGDRGLCLGGEDLHVVEVQPEVGRELGELRLGGDQARPDPGDE
ncbi:MAG: hypothetical protein FCKEOINB_02171 [Nitrosomonas sp.]|nr:hypothetical protein [Nitrosomonas sp.]